MVGTRIIDSRSVRLAAIQLDFQPSAVLDYPFIEEPALLAEGELGITSLSPSLPQAEKLASLRVEIAAAHERFFTERLIAIISELERFDIDIAVFPEYSVPASALPELARLAPSFCVIAASHTVTRDTMSHYDEIGLTVAGDDVGKSIAPVWLPSGKWLRIDKLSKSRWEGPLKLGSQWDVVECTNRRGEPVRFAVFLCVDLLNESDANVHQHVPREVWSDIDICIVPSYSPTVRDFEQRARAVAERQGRPVVYANVAAVGGTRVFCLFSEKEGQVERHGTRALAAGDEAVVLVDLPIGAYAQYDHKPSPLPVAPTSRVVAFLPFLDESAFGRFTELRDQVTAAEADTAVREIVEREKSELLRLAGEPTTPDVLKLKIFDLLGGFAWRDRAWLEEKLDGIKMPSHIASLSDQRFELLFKAQTTLAQLVNDPALKGSALDTVTSVLDAYRRSIDAIKPRVRPETAKRVDVTSLAIRTGTPASTDNEFTSTFIMRLKAARHNREGLEKQVRLISTLGYRENKNLGLTLRYISLPNPGGNLKNLRIEIVGAARSGNREDSRSMADGFRRDLANIMKVTLRDAYTFQLLEEHSDAAREWSPLPLSVKYAAELVRKVDFGTPPYVDPKALPRVFHLSASSSMARIVDMLQSQSSACMISIHLHPTSLTDAEEAFFTACQRGAEVPRAMNEAAMFFLGTERNPALRTGDAVTIQRMLGGQEGAHPNFSVRAFVVSDAPIAPLLLNTIGYDLWGDDTYDIHVPSSEHEEFREVVDTVRSCWAENTSPAGTGPIELRRAPALFDPYEASRLFRLPLEGLSAAVGTLFEVKPAPAAALPDDGIEIGFGFHSGAQKPIVVRLAEEERAKHTYIIGKTGTGKSTLLRRMIVQDIERGRGVCVIDPHGDLIESVLTGIPESRIDDVVLLDPSETDRPFGLNLLEFNPDNPHHRDFVVQETLSIMRKLFYFEHAGPVFEHTLRHLILTMLDESMRGEGTLIEAPRPLYDKEFRDALVPQLKDEFAKDFWRQHKGLGSDYAGENVWWVVSKLDSFIVDRIVRNIIGQAKSTINLPSVLEKEQILLVKLPSALIGEINSALLGMIILSKLRWAGMARAAIAPEDRRPYYVYVDEFQNFAASGFESILAEARKYGVSLILAHQHVGQLTAFNISSGRSEDKTAEAIFGNAATIISFRLGVKDAELIAKELGQPVEALDLENLKNYHAIVKTLIHGDVYPAFTIQTSLGALTDREGAATVAESIRKRSLEVYGRSRVDVEKSISERLARFRSARD